METKHTPGPWTAEQRDHTHMNIHAQGSHVAAVVRYATSDPGNRKSTRGGSEVGAANARLIASAPELLEEVCRLEAKIAKAMPARHDDLTAVSITLTGGDLDAIRALIAKATTPNT